ncbi:MAG: hypothetical protein Q7T55_10265 [Solirubrobacteraceae bacterium]|nr:hypothetical protein [Solirubrobacteraceae bacterium]
MKHALAIHSQFPDSERTLASVYWQPANANDLLGLAAHADELTRLVDLLGDDADPTFVVLTYGELFSEWAQSDSLQTRAHVETLETRYAGLRICKEKRLLAEPCGGLTREVPRSRFERNLPAGTPEVR